MGAFEVSSFDRDYHEIGLNCSLTIPRHNAFLKLSPAARGNRNRARAPSVDPRISLIQWTRELPKSWRRAFGAQIKIAGNSRANELEGENSVSGTNDNALLQAALGGGVVARRAVIYLVSAVFELQI